VSGATGQCLSERVGAISGSGTKIGVGQLHLRAPSGTCWRSALHTRSVLARQFVIPQIADYLRNR
jgi:hypothetical protein